MQYLLSTWEFCTISLCALSSLEHCLTYNEWTEAWKTRPNRLVHKAWIIYITQSWQFQNTSSFDTPLLEHLNHFPFPIVLGMLKGSSTCFIYSTHLSKHKDTRSKGPLLMLGLASWSRRHSAVSTSPQEHAQWRGVSPSLSIPLIWIKANLQWGWTHLVGLGLRWSPEGILLPWCAHLEMAGEEKSDQSDLYCRDQFILALPDRAQWLKLTFDIYICPMFQQNTSNLILAFWGTGMKSWPKPSIYAQFHLQSRLRSVRPSWTHLPNRGLHHI